MSQVLVDTSVVAALLEDGELAQRVRAVIGDARLHTSILALAEAYSLEQRRRLQGFGAALDAAVQVEPLSVADAAAGGRLHGRLRAAGHPKVALVDCLMYATSRRLGMAFVTLDGDLRDQPGVAYIDR